MRNYKKDFPIFKTYPHLAYLDSAASSQKPQQVIDAVVTHYRTANANVRRGMYTLAERATAAHEGARETVAKFIGAATPRNIIFTRNATESINLVAHAWARKKLLRGDEVLITLMEHHANIVPWHLLKEEKGIGVRFAGVRRDGTLDASSLRRLTTPRTKLAAFTHVSNVLGTINPAADLTVYFRKRGIPVLIDGAQAVGHMPVNVRDIGCDFYAFSGHKMFAPSGIGILYISDRMLEEMQPFLGGGEMIRSVSTEGSTYEDMPWKLEAGTPAVEAAVGLGEAIRHIERIGLGAIRRHERSLVSHALRELKKIPEVAVFGPRNVTARAGLIAFTVKGMHPHDIASLFAEDDICVRAGHHCAMPLHKDVLKVPATARASFSLYNDLSDVKRFLAAVRKAVAFASSDK